MTKFFPLTLSWYLIKHYMINFMVMLLALLAIIYLFDTVELLRRAANKEVPLSIVLLMGLYKLPEVGQLLFPFAILFGAMFTFWQLTRRHELVIMRSSGLSAWQFIFPVILTALFIGVFKITAINPLGALLLNQYKTMETQYISRKSSAISLSEQGLWLRQENGQGSNKGTAILHAEKIKMPDWKLRRVVVFFFDPENNFDRRIDAREADLDSGQWTFKRAVINGHQDTPEKADLISMDTNLTRTDIETGFLSPETISFWKLRSYTKVLEETGFNSTALKIYFQNLLAEPLLYMAMIVLAASVSLRPPRLRGSAFLILTGIVIGFFVFFISSFLQAMGASGQIPIFVAAWFPAIICFLLGVFALTLTEDG
jgi:lipopolysaccharide export system permease protein